MPTRTSGQSSTANWNDITTTHVTVPLVDVAGIIITCQVSISISEVILIGMKFPEPGGCCHGLRNAHHDQTLIMQESGAS